MKEAYIQQRIYKPTKVFIAKVNEILAKYEGKITVRQCFYQLVTENFIKNTKTNYDKTAEKIALGRKLGLIDWDDIEDRTRFLRRNNFWNSPEEILITAINQYHINFRETQKYYIEAWVEKDALIGLVDDVCRRYDIPCFSARGNPSITALHEASKRFIKNSDKIGILLYAGDHDPTGLNIPKNIQEDLLMFGADVEVKRIGLNLNQIKELKLPPNKAKETDKNFKKYYELTGLKESWELDALPPDIFMKLYEDEIHALTDFSEFEKMREKEIQDKSYFSKIMAVMNDDE